MDQLFLSEEDISAKILNTWLAGHGFEVKDINFEYAFDIRLGRNVYRVKSEKLQKTSSKF